MRTYTDVFLDKDDTDIRLSQLSTGRWVLKVDNLGIFMSDEHVKLIISAIGKEYWNLDVPTIEDIEEAYLED